ncbi:Inactive exonuclease DIS3L2, partial [Frankliniella fusca]
RESVSPRTVPLRSRVLAVCVPREHRPRPIYSRRLHDLAANWVEVATQHVLGLPQDQRAGPAPALARAPPPGRAPGRT